MSEVIPNLVNGVNVGADRHVDPETVHPDILEAREGFDRYYNDSPDSFFNTIAGFEHRDALHNQPYLHITEKGDSKNHVLLTQPPFGTNTLVRPGNTNSYNTLIKNYLLNFVARHRGITDPDGNQLSTLVVGRDDRDYTARFSPKEYWQFYNGNFSPYAKRVISIAQSLGYEAAMYYCYSASTATGGAVLKAAGVSGLEILGAALVEPVNFKKQGTPTFLKGYFGNYAPCRRPDNVTGHWWNDGPQVMLDLQKEFGDGSFLGNFIKLSTIPAVHGMAQDKLPGQLKDFMSSGRPVVLGYGENSGVAHQVGEIVASDEELVRFAMAGLLDIIRITGPGSGHDLGENHLVFAATFSDALKRIATKTI